MYIRNALFAGMKQHTIRFFLKGPGPSVLLAGTLAAAGLGAAALNQPAGASVPQDQGVVVPASLPSSFDCFNDPDGDGTIKCPSSVPISQLPTTWGTCQPDLYGDGLTVCEGTGN
jgi:hypothetical protein